MTIKITKSIRSQLAGLELCISSMLPVRLNHDFNYTVRRLNKSNVNCSCYYLLLFLDGHQIYVQQEIRGCSEFILGE